jgi:hypothetical protein
MLGCLRDGSKSGWLVGCGRGSGQWIQRAPSSILLLHPGIMFGCWCYLNLSLLPSSSAVFDPDLDLSPCDSNFHMWPGMVRRIEFHVSVLLWKIQNILHAWNFHVGFRHMDLSLTDSGEPWAMDPKFDQTVNRTWWVWKQDRDVYYINRSIVSRTLSYSLIRKLRLVKVKSLSTCQLMKLNVNVMMQTLISLHGRCTTHLGGHWHRRMHTTIICKNNDNVTTQNILF